MGLYLRPSCCDTPNSRTWLCIFHLLIFFVGLAWPSLTAMGQDAVDANTNQLPLRTNPQDVRLATLASSANTSPSSNESSPDQWRSLTTSQNDPMVTPSPSPPMPATNNISPLVSESSPKPMLKKDDYGPQTGWGLRTAIGPALQQSISARSQGGLAYSTINFDPGFRMDFETFYNVTNGFYFGLESGFIYNSISSTSNSTLGDLVAGGNNFGNGAFYQVPVLGNIRFQIPNTGKFRGYCTGGVGVVWDYVTASIYGDTFSQHQWNYAFQLGAGFQYNLVPGLDLDTSFKTFITPNPLIFSDSTSQVKASYNYALEIGLAYRF